ncbi:MAG: DUF2309 domain-containing protein [Rhodocyclales bacterium GT-UBC]|nr:MAG: DUF2309 domain-containing protein [Rhodocyclales bacterium GT-UBC]
MQHAADELPMRQRLMHWIEHLEHILPAQAPIRDFVHHNTLHGLQHLPFAEALAAAHRLTGAATYWPEAQFHAAYAAGRIGRDDLLQALTEVGIDDLADWVIPGVKRQDVLLASLLQPSTLPVASWQAWAARELGGHESPLLQAAERLAQAIAGEPAPAVEAWPATALARWNSLCERVGQTWTLRRLLEHLSGENVLEKVRSILQRHLAAHLDLGVAAWRNPQREAGFFAAWRASAGLDLSWEIDDLHNVRDEILHLSSDAADVLIDELGRLMPDDRLWPGYLERLALEQPGWAGMFLWRDRHPLVGDGARVEMVDYLAVRVLLERLLCEDLMRRLTGVPMAFDELRGYYATELAEFYVRDALRQGGLDEALQDQAVRLLEAEAHGAADEAAWQALAERIAASRPEREVGEMAQRLFGLCAQLPWSADEVAALSPAAGRAVLAVADSLDPLRRGQIWLQAYERYYREQLFSALTANQGRRPLPAMPSAQVVMCMDDREEGTRRHLEEIAPDIVTYGAAGFFGVPMLWQGLDDARPTALCPVVVQPRHLVREQPAPGAEAAAAGHARRRERRLGWREAFAQQTRYAAFSGPVLTVLGAVPALAELAATTLAPGWFGGVLQRLRQSGAGSLPTELALTAAEPANPTPETPQAGFTDAEQVERVAAFLRMIGLSSGFAPLVLIFGHGSGSRNNPHLSAYDCGACSGRHGGPNARVLAAMANRPAVRAGLAGIGIVIPETSWFIAAEHNTCDDGIEWYDLESVPSRFQPALDRLVHQLGEACRAHAAERCRRLASAPTRPSPWLARQHMIGRANDISQARPELGHATNAAAFIGRRMMSRGLFLDRRVFLISYDPETDDDQGRIVESILLAAGPVGAGIALEYYFSTVDNARFGCGSKITHNITGLFGVMEGADSDLRTGLPWQMVEIHEPMRLLVVVEQTTAVLTGILQRQPPLQELVGNGWITLAAKDPASPAIALYCPRRGWLPWSGPAVLPQVARSADWFAGESAPLAPAIILGGAT